MTPLTPIQSPIRQILFAAGFGAIALVTILLLGIAKIRYSVKDREPLAIPSSPLAQEKSPQINPRALKILKDVGEPFYERFGIAEEDFRIIKTAGFEGIEGNFDICADAVDVQFFLDSAEKFGLKVILNAGSGEAEWGYPCDENFDKSQKPVWQREKVREWVGRWKEHPALFLWDISNEAGGNFPFGPGGQNHDPQWETKYALEVTQLAQAYSDVKSFDPAHEIMICMNGWYFYDYKKDFFRPGNPFGKDVADVVMINAYSNVEHSFSDFIPTVLARATDAILKIEPGAKIIVALGTWEEPPIWKKPKPNTLMRDYENSLKTPNLFGIAFFKYGAREGKDWYLPDQERGGPELWQILKGF